MSERSAESGAGLTAETLAAWRAEASQYPSGKPCDGIHSRTPDARIVALVDLVERLRASVTPPVGSAS